MVWDLGKLLALILLTMNAITRNRLPVPKQELQKWRTSPCHSRLLFYGFPNPKKLEALHAKPSALPQCVQYLGSDFSSQQ